LVYFSTIPGLVNDVPLAPFLGWAEINQNLGLFDEFTKSCSVPVPQSHQMTNQEFEDFLDESKSEAFLVFTCYQMAFSQIKL